MTTQKTHAAPDLAASTKHTAGPWKHGAHAHAGEPVITDAHGRNIAFCNADRPEDEANARLIASAPELLAASLHLATCAEDANWRQCVALLPELESALESARAALAKAKGQP